MAEDTKLSTVEERLRVASYMVSIFYIIVFGANFIILVINRPRLESSGKNWTYWHMVDIVISGISAFAGGFLLLTTIWTNYRLLPIFIFWSIFCLILSVFVIAFKFEEYKREESTMRCIGVALTAFCIDIVLVFYLKLRASQELRIGTRMNEPREQLENDIVKNENEEVSNNAVSKTNQLSNKKTRSINICQWYEDTKL